MINLSQKPSFQPSEKGTHGEYNETVNLLLDHLDSTAEEELSTTKNLTTLFEKFESKTCSEVDKIYFLKTSKTGSTTIANILQRFGLRRPGTNFLMGEVNFDLRVVRSNNDKLRLKTVDFSLKMVSCPSIWTRVILVPMFQNRKSSTYP